MTSHLSEKHIRWPGLDLTIAREDATRPTEWSIRGPRDSVIVHLAGALRELETEVDGGGGSVGPALAGEVWTIPAGTSYRGWAEGAEISYVVFHLDPDPERPISGLGGVGDEFLHGVAARLAALATQKDVSARAEGARLATAVRRHVGRAFAASPARGHSLGSEAARALRWYVHANLSQRIALGELAEVAGMSPHHLLTAFRRAFGTTPTQYVIAQRLRQARRLLAADPTRDLTDVALTVGFSSHSHMTAAFKARLGRPPRAFRDRPVRDAIDRWGVGRGSSLV
ncbi:AraC family transcriptional regulator [Paludisphaera rhizosphaerae]|uniref:AraC family transcriptional regulator n=1 Tax=Paludisphaera rhizosphaerae TaxID=2711216 RepID=UPI0013EB5787|nr:AraC family transcriptional regulator [Paludisphaera rhizosphaerae]